MIDLDLLNKKTILNDELFEELIEDEDLRNQAKLVFELTNMAETMGVKKQFEILWKATQKMATKKEKGQKMLSTNNSDGMTNLDCKYPQMFVGNWIVNDDGIRTFGFMGQEIIACYQPILPVKKLINLETDKEKLIIAFKYGNGWRERTVDKEVIASSAKITSLAPYGLNVNTENSKHIVKYLADIENFNLDLIPSQMSTSKLGWHKQDFIPYSKDIIFDDEMKFKDSFEAIHEEGNFDVWMELVKGIRKSERFEPKIEMVASFGSVLIEPLNALPFILNIGGETGKGKTVAMMVATSIWANPAENTYMADAKGTVVSIELRMNFLNHLPMMIDDMSQVKKEYDGDFTKLVYLLCAGKGKDRSNINLGLNKSTSWKNIILTNYEYMLVTETMQGGAINRIIDVEAEDGLMIEDGNKVVEIISNNYGFAGRLFLDAVNEMGLDKIKEWQKEAYSAIVKKAEEHGVQKEEKQILPMSILLTADRIATEYIFMDGAYLNFETCVNLLKNKGEVSENERAYEYIISEIASHPNQFNPLGGEYKGEAWGCFDGGYAVIQVNVFNKICERGNFSSKSFLSWANKKNLIECTGSRNYKQKRFNNTNTWCVYLKMGDDGMVEVEKDAVKEVPVVDNQNGFVKVLEADKGDMPWEVE